MLLGMHCAISIKGAQACWKGYVLPTSITGNGVPLKIQRLLSIRCLFRKLSFHSPQFLVVGYGTIFYSQNSSAPCNYSIFLQRCIRVCTFANVFRYSRYHAHARRHSRVASTVCKQPFSPFSHCNRIVSIINEPRLCFSCLPVSPCPSLSLSPFL